MKKTMKRLLFSVLMSCLALFTYAQQRTVTGTVMDEQGAPLTGISYVLKGTTIGGLTNEAGNFTVAVTGTNPVLEFTGVGFTTQTVTVGNQTSLNVVMVRGDEQMEGVVVTALGIKRAPKSLGYAVQEVKGETLTATKELNVANALSGQVAGLQVVRSSNGPGGSSKILLRGFTSLTGNNQPLIIVDGVPINNFTGQSNTDFWNPSLDMGNGLSDLNAEDIASLSVLKGPSAAALYGSRAGNGVIVITTKTGRKQQGVGITINSSIGLETPFMIPKFQTQFGQGSNGIFEPGSGSSWGPLITGQNVKQWDSVVAPLSRYNNIDNYMKIGIISNQNISFQQQYGSTSVYSSYNRVDNVSMVPGSKLIRNNIMTRAVSKMGNDKLTLDAKVQYNNTQGINRPAGGHISSNRNTFAMLYVLPQTIDITDFKNPLRPNGSMLWYGSGNAMNPYWLEKYFLNGDVRDRFLLNASLRYDITKWLSAELRAGGDIYTTNTESKTYANSPLSTSGSFSMGKETFQETNYMGMLTAKKDDLFNKIGGSFMIGGNLMKQKYSSISGSANPLEVPNLFSLNNALGNPSVGQGFGQKRINSVLGAAQLSYDGIFYIDGTFRNDWSSALSQKNRSFFYPSISSSLILSEILDRNNALPSFLNYVKLRASYATVGNDMGAYQLYNTYWIGKDPNGITNAGRGNILYNDSVKSELIKNIELGTEIRVLNGRLTFDFSYYKSNATNQLLNIPMDGLSGYAQRKINAGNIQNEGVELMITGNVIQNVDGFNWSTILNLSRNRNKIIELSNALKITEYNLGGFDDLKVMAIAGKGYGDIYGSKYKRVTDVNSQYYGKLILGANGLPQVGEQKGYLGNQQADMLFGWTNNIAYKNMSLSFLIDGRFGGQIFSATNYSMQTAGTAAATVVNGERKAFIVDGVTESVDANKVVTYAKNTKEITPQLYWVNAGTGNLGINERNIYDATNIRLRNVQLNYQLPRKFVNQIGFQNAKFGVSCNNVWMLRSHLNGVDPESVFATGTNAIGFEYLNPPTTRTIFFNLSLTF